jgi:hypothetical protein
MKKTVVVAALAVSLGFLGTSRFQNLKADEWDQKTTLTFDQPVEVPGKVLPAGSYVFKLADSQSNRRVVQIFSADEKHLYATVLGITKDRLEPADKTIVTFEERSTGAPEAVKTWFYPGEVSGIQFVYHKQRALQLATNTNESVPAMTSEAMASQPAEPVPAAPEPATPENTSSQVSALKEEPVETVTPPQAETQPQDRTDQVATTQAVELPKTATELPLLMLLSGASLFGIFLIRYALKHTS